MWCALAHERRRDWVTRRLLRTVRADVDQSRRVARRAPGGCTPGVRQLCAEVRCRSPRPRLLSIATVMAEYADHSTGRHVAITRATIADKVGCDVRTVTAAWRVLRASRWAVEAQRGHGSTNTPASAADPRCTTTFFRVASPSNPGPLVYFPRRRQAVGCSSPVGVTHKRERACQPMLRSKHAKARPRHYRARWPPRNWPLDWSLLTTVSTAPTSVPSAMTHRRCIDRGVVRVRSTTSSTPNMRA